MARIISKGSHLWLRRRMAEGSVCVCEGGGVKKQTLKHTSVPEISVLHTETRVRSLEEVAAEWIRAGRRCSLD